MNKCVEWEICQMNHSHTLILEITKVQKVKWCMKQIHLKDLPFNTVWMDTLVRCQTLNQR